MELFNSFKAELQDITTLQTQVNNKQIDLRQKLYAAGWQAIHDYGSIYYISQDFINYIASHHMSKVKVKEYLLYPDDFSETDEWYGHIIYFGEE